MSPDSQAPRGGIDLGGTKIQAVVVDSACKVLGESRRPTPTNGGPEDVAREMAAAVREAADQAGVETRDLAGVGVGSPGDADEETGVVSGARNLPGWTGSFPLGEHLSEQLGDAGPDRQRRQRRGPRASSSSARGSRTTRSSASGGAPGSAAD